MKTENNAASVSSFTHCLGCMALSPVFSDHKLLSLWWQPSCISGVIKISGHPQLLLLLVLRLNCIQWRMSSALTDIPVLTVFEYFGDLQHS
jgi:hypothetical protein